MRIGRRLVKGLVWATVLVASILAGGLGFLFVYLTDGATVSRLIRESAARFLPGSTLEPGRVRLSILGGGLVLHEALIRQPVDSTAFTTLRVPYLQVGFSPRRLLQGRLEVTEIRASHPVLRLTRRKDGTWNIQGLLADPWPGPKVDASPPITITNGTLELVDDAEIRTADGRPVRAPAVLRELSLRIETAGGSRYKFEGSARGDMFDRLALEGTMDLATGVVELSGSLSGMTISEAFRRRIPLEARAGFQQLAMSGGVVDVESVRVLYDPRAAVGARLRYEAELRLRDAVWECSKLPFPLSEVSAHAVLSNDRLVIKHLEGTNGQTTARAQGVFALGPVPGSVFDLRLDLSDLELDERLRMHTPKEFDDLWDLLGIRGRVDSEVHLQRAGADRDVDVSAVVTCRDVAGVYRDFKYPLDHITGQVRMAGKRVTLDLHSLVGGKPLSIKGQIDDPGEDAVVHLEIEAEAAPVDDLFKKALPPDIRKLVDEFNPSGVVHARAVVDRRPEIGPGVRPEGLIAINADIDLDERCEMTWNPLPFPLRDLKGRLELHPDSWIFKNIRGRNGQTMVAASGSVERLPIACKVPGQDPLKVDVVLQAVNLPFTDELKRSLQPGWRKAWDTINPAGACDIETAEVHVYPGKPDRTHIVIIPRKEASVRLEVPRTPGVPKEKGGIIELRMDRVGGRFVFDDGAVGMKDVSFEFRGAPAYFTSGTVQLEDTGRFDLAVTGLRVEGIRFDPDLRKKMPHLMSQLALRIDDGKTFSARGDLEIGWSGRPGDLAWCRWDNTLVVFLDNTVRTAIPLEHIQGQIERMHGWTNGTGVELAGVIRLDSVVVAGQQITAAESPFSVKGGLAKLENLQARYLGGRLLGQGQISLDTTPRYQAQLSLDGAKLEQLARTLPGRQSFEGLLSARVAVSGLGTDVHNVHGQGEGHVTQGRLGELPPLFKLARVINRFLDVAPSVAESPRNPGRTAFDSADVVFTIDHGTTRFDPIKFTGNAFSLQGQGTLDPQGALDLKLSVLLGRDRFHVPFLSDFTREASTPFLIARVKGTLSYPQPTIEALPQFRDFLKRLGRREESAPR